MSALPFQTAAIFGPGLLGGSIALAVKKNMPECDLRLWARRDHPLQLAEKLGITSHTYRDAQKAAAGADLIILATPIGAFEELVRHTLPAIGRDTLVTDIGSVKAYVHRTTGALLTERGRLFVGSHPMAGAETQGLENASETLLQGATVAITNPHGVDEERVRLLETFWRKLGGATYRMTPVNHDQTVARISHMPHIMAALCAHNATAGKTPLADLRRMASTGFKDTTRVSSGAASMWADILWENDVAIRQTLHDCVKDLHSLISLLENQDKTGVRTWLEEAKASRETIIRQE